MRSKKVTLSIPHTLLPALEKHAVELGYKNAKDLLLWCSFYSLMVQRPHTLTAPISQCPLAIQDEIIEKVVGAYNRGEIKHGSFFEATLAEIIERLGVQLPRPVIDAVIADVVRNPKKPREAS